VAKRDATAGYYGDYYGYQPRRKADLASKPASKGKAKRRSKRRGADVVDLDPAELRGPTSRRL
jgi:hypothetical protein